MFKAKVGSDETADADEVEETKDTQVELPIDQVEAEEVAVGALVYVYLRCLCLLCDRFIMLSCSVIQEHMLLIQFDAEPSLPANENAAFICSKELYIVNAT